MKTINYTGSSKLISRIVNLLNRKVPLPLDGDGNPDWGTNGQVLSTNGVDEAVWVNAGGGSGGHTIWNRIKTALTARGKLWFADASVSDVSADDATKVEVVTELASESAFDNLPTDGTADGIYAFPNSGGEYLTAVMSSYDNTASGLSANDVQDAIDELANGIYYKDVAIAGKTISNYYVAFDTGVNSTLYQAIGFASVAGSWDTGLTVEVSTDNYIKLRSARTASYTIASNIKPIRVYFVKANRINTTPLS